MNRVKVPTVWDARYNVDAAPLTSTTKQARVVKQAGDAGLLDVRLADPRPSASVFKEIARYHYPSYVKAVATGHPKNLAESQGFTWSPEFAESVAQIWHGHEHALHLLMTNQAPLVLHPVSGAHHAHPDRGGGFCTFNYLIGAADRYLADPKDQGLIIDLDAHFGDGTEKFIENDPRFTLFDIHGGIATKAAWEFAFEGKNRIFAVANAAEYLKTLKRELPKVLDAQPWKFVQYLAGADPFEEDPVGSVNGMGIKQLRERDRFVIEEVLKRGIPMVVTLAGGYVPGKTEKIHVNTVREMARALRRGGQR